MFPGIRRFVLPLLAFCLSLGESALGQTDSAPRVIDVCEVARHPKAFAGQHLSITGYMLGLHSGHYSVVSSLSCPDMWVYLLRILPGASDTPTQAAWSEAMRSADNWQINVTLVVTPSPSSSVLGYFDIEQIVRFDVATKPVGKWDPPIRVVVPRSN